MTKKKEKKLKLNLKGDLDDILRLSVNPPKSEKKAAKKSKEEDKKKD